MSGVAAYVTLFAPVFVQVFGTQSTQKSCIYTQNLLPRNFMWTSGYDEVELVERTENEAEVVIGVLVGL
jgi:hypothetical protein